MFELLTDLNIDICCLTETWLRKGDTSKVCEIKELGYNIHHVSRAGRGGGVGIAYKKNLDVTKRNSKSYKSFEHTECVVRSTSNEILTIVCIYRSGTVRNSNVTDFCTDFDEYLSQLNEKRGKLLIAGDFNIHLEDEDHPDTIKFISVLNQNGLQQNVNQPTHDQGGIIDLILTRKAEIADGVSIADVRAIPTNTASDHFFILSKCQFSHTKKTNRRVISARNIKNINIDNFRSDILQSELNDSDHFKCAENAVVLYNEVLLKVLDLHAPLREFTIREDQPAWITKDCQQAKAIRRKLERTKDKSNDQKHAYNRACKNATTVLNTARNFYYKNKLALCNNDMKKTYSIVNHLMDKNTSLNHKPNHKDTPEVAEEMKNYFIGKVEDIYQEVESLRCDTADVMNAPDFNGDKLKNFDPIGEEDLMKVISELNKKECELDPIPLKLLMKCLPELKKILLFIVNSSLSEGVFPSPLKEALIRPNIKDLNGDPNDVKNYRPISNLPFLSKILEKCVQKQLSYHLAEHKLHAKYQSGYKVNHSCETVSLSMYDDLLCLSDAKNKVIVMLLDLSAAFDTVCHSKLLNKLHNKFGLSDTVLKWFTSYLKDRSFTVQIEKSKSSKCWLRIGVPQGSILGPILFILYTKELELIAKKHGLRIHMYADDTQLYIEFNPLYDQYSNIEEKIAECFKEVSAWMMQNILKLNPKKTEVIVVKSKNNFDNDSCVIPSIKLSDKETISCSKVVKSLGVYFDEYLTFNHQISSVVQSCNITLRNLWTIAGKLSFELKRQLVHCLLFSKLDYCNGLYYGLPDIQLKRLQKLQNCCVRFLYGKRVKPWDSIRPFLKEAHFLPIKERVQFKIALMVFKSINNIAPDYLRKHITVKGQLNRSLRHENDFFLLETPQLPRLVKTHRGISYSAPKIWNNLPYEVRSSNDIVTFKKNLKTYLFGNAFKDV